MVVGDGEGEVEGDGRASGGGGEAMAGLRSSSTTPSNRRTYCPVSVGNFGHGFSAGCGMGRASRAAPVNSSRPSPAKFRLMEPSVCPL